MIKKVLVANRGEIACRVFRTARAMGIRTVAVYSEADAKALHVFEADESVALGGSEPSESYLSIDKILAAAAATGADAIHPGYGFLSERAEFADACGKAGITFIGPSAAAMRRLGAKTDAKQLAFENQVPIVPGLYDPNATTEELKHAALKIGYPVMLKASAGGGGRGMRAVRDPEHFDDELRIASDEALKAFGDGTMMVEKLVDRPRHVEVQIIADSHGNVAPLFERECSLQRRHQKVVEEATCPIPNFGESIWPRMREAAVKLIKAAGYTGAGTVEFIVDEKTGEFFFLEVNARLQVEHPVTEMITGLDLVEWQLRVAASERLVFDPRLIAGDRAAIQGHAVEARIVAEDPGMGFLPSVGKIIAWQTPMVPGVRVDTGYGPNAEIPRFYDSLVAKVIAHGSTRSGAIDKLRSALLDFHVLGIKTNIAYLLDVLDSVSFRSGAFDTGTLGREFAEWTPGAVPPELGDIIEAAVTVSPVGGSTKAVAQGAWAISDGFRNAR